MVINGKKLTVKFFLNKDVKGKRFNVGPVTQYPLYTRVTYNRKTTNFIAGNNWFVEDAETDLENNPVLKKVKSAIEKIVAYEVENSSGEYKIKGLGDRVKTYTSNLSEALNRSLTTTLSKELGNIMPHNKYQEWSTLPFEEKVKNGLKYLGDNLSNNLQVQAVLAELIRQFGGKINVFAWLMSNERFDFIERLKELGQYLRKEESIPLAFELIPIIGLKELSGIEEIVRLLDEVCSQLLDLKYTSFVEAKSINFDEVNSIINLKLK